MSARAIFTVSLFAFACERPATQLIVVIDTDYAVPNELGFIRAVVRDQSGNEISSLERALIATENEVDDTHAVVPCSFAVVPKDGDASRQVIIEVEGFDQPQGRSLVARRTITGFIEKKSLLVSVFLAKSCEGRVCGAGQSCSENGCVAESVDPHDLPEVTPGNEFMPRFDAGVPDSGTADGATDLDATTADAAENVGDAGPDAGVDGGCSLPNLGAPAVIGTVTLPHPIDRALLAADVDGDGANELVATRGGLGTSEISVIDFDECGTPGFVSTTISGDLRRQPAFVEGMSGPEIWLPIRDGIEAWRYSLLLGTPLEREATILSITDLEQLAIASDGGSAGAIVRHSSWGMAHVGTMNRQEMFAGQTDRSRSLAYVGQVASGALFAGPSQNALYLLEPGQANSSLPIAALSAPASVGPDPDFGSASAAIIVAKADRAIVSVRIDLATGATVTSSISFPTSILSDPILVRVANEVRVYVQLGSDLLTWCTLSASASSVGCALANPNDGFIGGETEESDDTELLSAYLDDDSTPDIVVIDKEGDVHFRSGVSPADPAAPTVRLIRESPLASALVPRFWSAFGASGDLLAVPFPDGTVVLISWSPPANPPVNSDGLWTQHRKDAQRSAHLP